MRRNDEEHLRPSAHESDEFELVADTDAPKPARSHVREFIRAVWHENRLWLDRNSELVFAEVVGREPKEGEVTRMIEIAWDKCDLSRVSTGRGVWVDFTSAGEWFRDAMKKEYWK